MKHKLAAALGLCALLFCSTGCKGDEFTRDVWRGSCESKGSLHLQVQYADLGFPMGWHTAWGLSYQNSSQTPAQKLWIYNNGVVPDPMSANPVSLGKYVAWRIDGTSVSGDGPSNDYTPMPAPADGRIIIFDPAAGVGPPEPAPSGDPLFMNVFINPMGMSSSDFNVLAQCLASHREELDAAMARLPDALPLIARRFLTPLKLGGIAYELPPLGDPNFMDAVATMRSAQALPLHGAFILYPGKTAVGRLAGHTVKLTATKGDEPSVDSRLEVDGVVVEATSNSGATNVPGVSVAGDGWMIDGPICPDGKGVCGAMIDIWSRMGDGSELFRMGVRTGVNTYG